GGCMMIVVGLVRRLGPCIAAISMRGLGGAEIVLFGSVAASVIRYLSTVKYEGNMNLIIVASALGFGMIPVVSPDFYSDFPSWVETIFDSGISSSATVAVILNIIFNELTAGRSPDPSVVAARGV